MKDTYLREIIARIYDWCTWLEVNRSLDKNWYIVFGYNLNRLNLIASCPIIYDTFCLRAAKTDDAMYQMVSVSDLGGS